jgi:lactate dehydrogenase-like 2-hydroxyacid dehydrogenase
MAGEKAEVLALAPKQTIVAPLEKHFTVHKLWEAPDRDAFLDGIAPRVRAIASAGGHAAVDAALMGRLPHLEIVSSFGVGYDHVDAKWAARHGIVVTNTPDVLTEEVADTAVGLMLCTVREFPQAERYVRDGKWTAKNYPLSRATMRDRTVGMVGLGRIGKAIARRIDAMGVPIVYYGRNRQPDVPYRYYDDLVTMARDVDILMVITPGGAATQNLINTAVLDALGPNGILINMARGSVVDEPALIAALKDKKILSAGLDVFVDEPKVPSELLEMDHVVLFPHLGSASVHTRQAMDQLVVDNLVAWAAGKPPLTPVPETPWSAKRK